jgi:hypothetical protein
MALRLTRGAIFVFETTEPGSKVSSWQILLQKSAASDRRLLVIRLRTPHFDLPTSSRPKRY